MDKHYLQMMEKQTPKQGTEEMPIRVVLPVADRAEAETRAAELEHLFGGKTHMTWFHTHKPGTEANNHICIIEDL